MTYRVQTLDPIHLQDNLSKTPLAQEVMDRMVEGANKAKDHTTMIVLKEMEQEAREKTVQTEEKPGLSSIRSEDKSQTDKRKRRKKKKLSTKTQDEPEIETRRLRRAEDDEGKGEGLDIML